MRTPPNGQLWPLCVSPLTTTLNVFSLPSTMYWSDWGNHPKIETAAMDGTLRETLVQENIQWPTGPRHRPWEGQEFGLGWGAKVTEASSPEETIRVVLWPDLGWYKLSHHCALCLTRTGCGLLQ